MTERHMEAAQRYYNLAVLNDFNKGRKTVNVASACLYIVCRMEKTSHLLIDFSDVLQVCRITMKIIYKIYILFIFIFIFFFRKKKRKGYRIDY